MLQSSYTHMRAPHCTLHAGPAPTQTDTVPPLYCPCRAGSDALHAVMVALQAQAKMDINSFASYYQQPHAYPPPAAAGSDAYAAIVARLKAAGIPPGSGGEMVAAAAAMAAVGGPAALSQLMANQGSMQDTAAASAIIEAQARLQSQAAAAAAVAHLAASGSYNHGHGHNGYGPAPPTLLQSAYQLTTTAAAGLQHIPSGMDPAAAAAAKAMEQLAAGASAMQHGYMPQQGPYAGLMPHPHSHATATLSGGQQYMQYSNGLTYSEGGTFPTGPVSSKGVPEAPPGAVSSGGPVVSGHQHQAPDRPSLKRPSTSQEVQPGRKKQSQ